MPKILIVEKTGNIKCEGIKNFSEEDLYKKCNFKNGNDFKLHATWEFVSTSDKICLYGKTIGRANHENKYDFPPPADNILFFGSCVLVLQNSKNEVLDLSSEIWENRYNILFGGFDDLNKEDSDDDSEEEELVTAPRTKSGYVKDGFVVDDFECETEVDDSESDSDYEEVRKKRKIAAAAPKKKPAAATPKKRAAAKTAAQISAEVESAADALLEMSISTPQTAPQTPPAAEKKKRTPRAPKKAVRNDAPQSQLAATPIPFPSLDDINTSDPTVQQPPPERSIYEESPELVEEDYV